MNALGALVAPDLPDATVGNHTKVIEICPYQWLTIIFNSSLNFPLIVFGGSFLFTGFLLLYYPLLTISDQDLES